MTKNALYYLGIIEGVAHARGEDAYPVKFWHALKMLADELAAPAVLPAPETITESPDDAEVELPPLTRVALAKAAAHQPKPRKQWSPEARAAASERMRARRASGREDSDEEKVARHLAEKGKVVGPTRYAAGSV